MAPKHLVRQLAQLKAARESGALAPDNYQKALLELRAVDKMGIWWAVDPATSGFVWYDQANKLWVPAQGTDKALPPSALPAPVQAELSPATASPQTGQDNKAVSLGPTAKELIGTLKRAIANASSPSAPPASAKDDPAPTATSAQTKLKGFAAFLTSPVAKKFTGPLVGVVLFVISVELSVGGWGILGYIPSTTRSLASPTSCQGLTSSLATFLCSFNGAGFALLGSFLVALVMFLLRWPLTKMATSLVKPLPSPLPAFVLSLMATMFFAMAWSGSHPKFSGESGFIEENAFPAFIGLFTYITFTCHQGFQRRLDGFFTRRDKTSKWRRLAVAMAVPSVLSILLRMGPRPARLLADQTVVLVSLILGYLLFTPRSGAPAGQDLSSPQKKKTST